MTFNNPIELETFAKCNLQVGTEVEFKRTKDGITSEFAGTIAPRGDKQGKQLEFFILDQGDHLPASERYRSFNLKQITSFNVLATS